MENFEVHYDFSMYINTGSINFILLTCIIKIITAVIHIHLTQGVYNKKSLYMIEGVFLALVETLFTPIS